MTTKELINTFEAWKCKKGHRTYVAVTDMVKKADAKRIANVVFKTDINKLKVTNGFKCGDYIYKSLSDVPNFKYTQIWIVERI